MSRAWPVAVGLLALALLLPAPAGAQRASLPDVEDEVLCVTCGIPLNVSEAPAADRQREEIRRLIDRGLTKAQVKARLVDVYGPRVLAVRAGDDATGAVGWLLPAGLLLAAVLGLAAALLAWRRRGAGAATAAPPTEATAGPPTSGEARRLDADLARYD